MSYRLPVPYNTQELRDFYDVLRTRWSLHARPEQLPPEDEDDWSILMYKTGRGWGKTRTAVELIRYWIESGRYGILHLVGPTASAVRSTMIEGESGLLACAPKHFYPKYEPSKTKISWPNGAYALLFTAEEPDRLRGPQCEAWWADEIAHWKYAQETWDMLQFGARLGSHVQGVITSTPRPIPLVKEIVEQSKTDTTVRVVSGHTQENAKNLAPTFMKTIYKTYGGTRLGRQELAGEIIEDSPGAIAQRDWIERNRVTKVPKDVSIIRKCTAIDPSATKTGDEAGIVTVGKGSDGVYYVFSDDSLQATPHSWATIAIAAYHKNYCDCLIYEANQGGDMVLQTIRAAKDADEDIAISRVWASEGKYTRAEPVSLLMEQDRVKWIGSFPKLEDECCQWNVEEADKLPSPNRMDAYVWAVVYLMRRGSGEVVMR